MKLLLTANLFFAPSLGRFSIKYNASQPSVQALKPKRCSNDCPASDTALTGRQFKDKCV